ncbi:hypothetical protein DH2020_038049 [Rehmannia glutinosa]|uniref:Cytochrome P450 n=1 Tax=Rehmannia glutinosa TaxID=99300 RepID=A0ABR0V0D5_REHGL
MDMLGTISIGDFIPWLSWFTRVNGFDKRVDKVAKGLDDFLEGVIKEHMETPNENKNVENFLDILLQFHTKNTSGVLVNRDSIKALIMETLRYHPPMPLLVPRVALADVNIKGYNILAGTLVMINAFTISGTSSWDEPNKFQEIFLNSSIDFKGLDLSLFRSMPEEGDVLELHLLCCYYRICVSKSYAKFNRIARWSTRKIYGHGTKPLELQSIEFFLFL